MRKLLFILVMVDCGLASWWGIRMDWSEAIVHSFSRQHFLPYFAPFIMLGIEAGLLLHFLMRWQEPPQSRYRYAICHLLAIVSAIRVLAFTHPWHFERANRVDGVSLTLLVPVCLVLVIEGFSEARATTIARRRRREMLVAMGAA